MIKHLAASAMIAGAVIVPAVSASATVDPVECENFARPIIISNGYDPLHLDTDGDGIACEGNPGEPVKTDLYADLKGDEVTPGPTATRTVTATPADDGELAATGSGNVITRHPVRSIGVGVIVVGAGGALVLASRRRHPNR